MGRLLGSQAKRDVNSNIVSNRSHRCGLHIAGPSLGWVKILPGDDQDNDGNRKTYEHSNTGPERHPAVLSYAVEIHDETRFC